MSLICMVHYFLNKHHEKGMDENETKNSPVHMNPSALSFSTKNISN